MEVYADESGIHGGSQRCVVAGIAGGKRQLQLFQNDWKAILSDFAIPLDKGFHAKTFFKKSCEGKRFSVYEGWDHSRSQKFVRQLVEAVKSHRLHPVGAAVDISHFNSLSYNLRRWLTGGIYDEDRRSWVKSGAPTKPYFYAFNQVIIGSAAEAKPGVQIDYVFDRQDNFRKHALNLWNVMKDGYVWRTGTHMRSISFKSRLERVALQAADLIAFCAYHGDKYRVGTDEVEIAFVIHNLIAGQKHMKRFDAEALALLIPAYPESLKRQDDRNSRNRISHSTER